ncbi:universal stress protein [Cellulomonas sp. ES6]|uniref:universal stress protein n=1 Tax=Cellulomonas sp. ES6 TaxID=3039384 RepID=UPI0024B6D31D|nr:universal stress protein [Cellulomonas sp. ES6]WHP18168.1 universal stress protein [Cellulomonas sp. ES6]
MTEVVVGVAGTLSSERAVHWAGEQAAARGAELVLVHAVGRPRAGYGEVWEEAVRAGVREMLEREAERVCAAVPDLKARTEIDLETPARSLTERSAGAALVVVGTRRLGPTQRVFSGSLAYQVVAGAQCPVAVVPPLTRPAADRVVVGTDGSAESAAAVRAAAVEAARTGGVLDVVHAWQEASVLWAVRVPPDLGSATHAHARAVLEAASAGLEEEHPGLEVRRRLVETDPAGALLAAADSARLLVVGSRGLHGVSRMLLGSTSHAVVLHSPCPVLVERG